jgi:hypothetical protein
MATSPNYGWSEPDNTSLVRDGALAMRTLGDAIDTSVWNVGYGQAGKNKIINGDFGIWQRGTSFAQGIYTADRFLTVATGSTGTISQQAFTAGTAPVSGYEAQYFCRTAVTSSAGAGNFFIFAQYVENVRTFAGQTATFSFWAKADASKSVAIEFNQVFGSGGSSPVNTSGGQFALTTSWTRYSVTVALPSISGKTIGTNSYLNCRVWLDAGSNFNSRTGSLGQQSITFDTWGWQLEYGSKATPFQTATGTIQGELAACQRYYQRFNISNTYQQGHTGWAYGTSDAIVPVDLTVQMRVAPTALETNNLRAWIIKGVTYVSGAAFTLLNSSPNQGNINVNKGTAFTVEDTISLNSENQSSVYYAFTAEL